MTEDEAKLRWCPFSRVAGFTIEPSYNREMNGIAKNSECLASACMAWRTRPISSRMNPPGGPDQRSTVMDGYCGLAGQPS
jgi:hypothetical protein